MKIAVLSDIHANRAALDAVLEDLDGRAPDQVVVAGDVINRGPEPAACLKRILECRDTYGWHLLKGNHEDFVIQERRPDPARPAWLEEVHRHSIWTSQELEPYLDDVTSWPNQVDIEGPNGSLLRIVHASNIDNRTGLYARMSDEEMLRGVDDQPDVFCVGHTHVPFTRRIRERLVVNAGAVGLPFDGNIDASYALFSSTNGTWSPEIIRVPYDRHITARAYDTTGYRDAGGAMIPLILDELEHARPNLRKWHTYYEAAVASGKMTVPESVEAFLENRESLSHRPVQ
jgi:predicted phosphodiesterase